MSCFKMFKILVIDNEVDVLTVVSLILSGNGFEVDTISDWRKTFKQAEAFNPDLILLDISLGGEDGRNICGQLKQNDNTKHIPVILFSANHNLEENYSEFKADGFIAKPFDSNHLVDKLRLQLAV